tara:strand:+ start:3833 stop:4024 length:192 start_codon:yes stop_codon:yes gene_type:complete
MKEKQFKSKLVEWYNDYKISVRVEYWLDPETNDVVLDKQEMRQSLRSEIQRLSRLLRFGEIPE